MKNPVPLLEIFPPHLPTDQSTSNLNFQDFDDLPEVLKPINSTRVSHVEIKETRELITTKILSVISRSYDYLDQKGIRTYFTVNFFSRGYNPLLIFISPDSQVSYQESSYSEATIAKLGYEPRPNKFSKVYKIENPDGFSFELASEEADVAVINKFKDGNLFSTITVANGKIISEAKI